MVKQRIQCSSNARARRSICCICLFVLETIIIISMRRKNVTIKGVYVMTVKHSKVCAVTDSRLLGKLSSEAEFSCARCGAKAHDKASVCEPVPLEPDH